MTVLDTLRGAADIIDKRGWTQGRNVRAGGVCANGAFRLALGGVERRRQLSADLPARVDLDFPDDWTDAEFNTYSAGLDAAHAATGEYLRFQRGLEPTTSYYQHRPTVWFNDHIAVSKEDVTGLLRATADWLEAGVAAQVNATLTLDKELVSA